MRRRLTLSLAGTVLLSLLLATTVSAHNPVEQAPNTPSAANFSDADWLDEHPGALNAEFRNPACGAHDGANGIHPPGNP